MIRWTHVMLLHMLVVEIGAHLEWLNKFRIQKIKDTNKDSLLALFSKRNSRASQPCMCSYVN